jgi:hypothetical protein
MEIRFDRAVTNTLSLLYWQNNSTLENLRIWLLLFRRSKQGASLPSLRNVRRNTPQALLSQGRFQYETIGSGTNEGNSKSFAERPQNLTKPFALQRRMSLRPKELLLGATM